MVPREYDAEIPSRKGTDGLRDKILILLIAAAAGTGGTLIYRQIDPPAPDRFTGTQARLLKSELESKVENHEARLVAIERAHERIFLVQENIRTVVQRIEVEIAKLPPDEWRARIRQLERKQFDREHSGGRPP